MNCFQEKGADNGNNGERVRALAEVQEFGLEIVREEPNKIAKRVQIVSRNYECKQEILEWKGVSQARCLMKIEGLNALR